MLLKIFRRITVATLYILCTFTILLRVILLSMKRGVRDKN